MVCMVWAAKRQAVAAGEAPHSAKGSRASSVKGERENWEGKEGGGRYIQGRGRPGRRREGGWILISHSTPTYPPVSRFQRKSENAHTQTKPTQTVSTHPNWKEGREGGSSGAGKRVGAEQRRVAGRGRVVVQCRWCSSAWYAGRRVQAKVQCSSKVVYAWQNVPCPIPVLPVCFGK